VGQQREALLEVVSGVNGFAGLRTGEQGIAMRRAARQLVLLLGKLGRLMSDVLAPGDHTAMASVLMEAVASQIVTAILGQSNISIQELPTILSTVVEEGPTVILQLSQPPPPGSQGPQSVPAADGGPQGSDGTPKVMGPLDEDLKFLMQQTFIKRTPSLNKLHRLLAILEARLGQIVEWWDRGTLREAGFSSEEVRRLIYSCFEHSDYREDCISHVR
ncbi:unnamed protein product, partial [Ostreobium quekettii]